jgi:CelD/BcsL family acetyltransferase involved in cellulose biosynthesis
VRARVIDDPGALTARRGEWDALLASCATSEVTMTPEWLLAWWRTFGDLERRKLRAVIVEDGARMIGLAPLLTRVVRHRPGIPFRRLELLASGEPEEDEICSDYLSVLAARGAEANVASAIADTISKMRWDELVLPAMSGDALAPLHLAGALHLRGVRVELATTTESPYVALPAKFDEYTASLSKRRRYLVRRSLRDLDEWAGGKGATVEHARDATDLPKARAILEALHAERWREHGHEGVFASQRFKKFHDEVIPALHARGAVELSWLVARGEPIAAVYNLVWNGRVQVYQSGRRVDFPDEIRPGLVLHARLIERAIAAKRVEYDFLAGVTRYKQELAPLSRPIVSLRAVRAPVREQARLLFARGLDAARAVRDRLRGSPG